MIGRLPEIQYHQTPPRLQDTSDLTKTIFHVSKVSKPIAYCHQV